MAETEDQQNNDRIRSRRIGTVGDHNMTNNNVINSELSGEVNETLPYKTCSEYVQHLNVWILQTQYCNWFSSNYPLIMSQMASFQSQPNLFNTNSLLNNNNNNTNVEIGRVYAIPRLWKRVAAEVIDFCFLLILKLMVTYVAVDYLELIDLDKFDLSLLDNDFDAFQIAYELTSEIIIIEMIHRFIVCAYETICLYRGQLNRDGGSTPGKAIFGITVVSCDSIDEVGDGLIRVIPAKNIGILRSLLRALIKNLSAVFFIPASLTVFFWSHNRAAYDIACKCIVVEEIGIESRARQRRN